MDWTVLWSAELKKLAAEAPDTAANHQVRANINKRIIHILYSESVAVILVLVAVFLAPFFKPYWPYVLAFMLITCSFDAYRQITNFFNRHVIPINSDIVVAGKLLVQNKHTIDLGVQTGWNIEFEFEYEGQSHLIKRRIEFKKDLSLPELKDVPMKIHINPANIKNSVPAFSSLISLYQFKRG